MGKALTRRLFLDSSLRFMVGMSALVSSCALNEDKHYRFDLSRLENWQADLFLEAGRYWGVNDGRDDSSRNKVYFGQVPKEKIAYAEWNWKYPLEIGELLDQNRIYTFKVTFKKDLKWVNCDDGEFGNDFYNTSIHEWGHIVNENGKHSSDPGDIMYGNILQRCLIENL